MVNIAKPTVGGSVGTWGTELNTALDTIVNAINTGTGGGTGSGSGATITTSGAGIDRTGTTDVTAALQALINSSPAGSTILFDPGTYVISAPLILQPGRSYVGAGHNLADGATIRLASGTNLTNTAGLTGLLVAQAWATNQTDCDPGILIANLAIDGNAPNNATSTACGIVLCSFWALVTDCYLYDIPMHAVLLTDTTANGTNVVTNTCSENKLYRLKIDHCGGDGIHQVSANGNSNQDGYLADCLISDVAGGIIFDRSAGWTVRRNHLYAVGESAIQLGLTFATICEANYIEDFGGDATAATYYSGIACTQLDYRGSHIVNNYISCDEPGTTAVFTYLDITAGNSQTDARVICTGNLVRGGGTANGTGLAVQHQTGGVLTGTWTGNYFTNMATAYAITAGDSSTWTTPGAIDVGARMQSTSAPLGTVTVGTNFQTAASVAAPLNCNDIAGSITCTAKASPVLGAMASYTFAVAYPTSPRSIALTPTNAAAATARIYVSAQSATAFTVSCAVAPTASQVLTFNYQILA